MKNSSFKKKDSNVSISSRWNSFLRDSKKRTLAIVIYTIFLVVLAVIFKNYWLLVFGQAVLWVVVLIWYSWKKMMRH